MIAPHFLFAAECVHPGQKFTRRRRKRQVGRLLTAGHCAQEGHRPRHVVRRVLHLESLLQPPGPRADRVAERTREVLAHRSVAPIHLVEQVQDALRRGPFETALPSSGTVASCAATRRQRQRSLWQTAQQLPSG
jgi:hypothetical protein